MRNKLLSVLLLALIAPAAWAQGEKPLSQTEFVKYLYGLQGNAAKRDELVEILRKRGISFELTSGLRGLVRSKSKSDELLSRTLEESARRRANPTASALPGEKESAEVLAKAKEATLAAVEEMPDFVVKQIIQRSNAYAGTGSWKPQDRLTVAVNYSTTKGEDYKVLAINGVPQSEEKSEFNYMKVGGTTSAGEFVTVLKSIFSNESKTEFAVVDTDTLRGRRSIVYTFNIKRENSKQKISSYGLLEQSTISGSQGRLWIDRENFRVLRVESIATEIPGDFPVTAASRNIDYDWVTISDQKYLLPIMSDVRLTSRYQRDLFESRNLIAFRNYQKYGSEVKILDDEEVVEEPQKP